MRPSTTSSASQPVLFCVDGHRRNKERSQFDFGRDVFDEKMEQRIEFQCVGREDREIGELLRQWAVSSNHRRTQFADRRIEPVISLDVLDDFGPDYPAENSMRDIESYALVG
ncbi:MAG TPA: hypothetical protein VIL97_00545 [Thermoanaerobaculia bacterium]